MNKKLLCAALLCGLGVAQAASAQTFDDRWYITGSAGINIQDNDRGTNNAPFGAIGFGKFLNPNWSLDAELNYQNPTFSGTNNIVNITPDPVTGAVARGQDLNWSQSGISVDLRRHFIAEGRSWNPYLLMGLGYQRHEEEYDNFPNPDSPATRSGGNVAGKLGVGVQGDLGRVGIRTELAMRPRSPVSPPVPESGTTASDSVGWPRSRMPSWWARKLPCRPSRLPTMRSIAT